MAEDWRVTVTLADESARSLATRLEEHDLEQPGRAALGGRVAISADPTHVFLYANTRAAAAEAERVVASLLEGDGRTATFALDRWHPLEEEWEPGDVPLPVDEADRRREQERLEEQDAVDSAESGRAAWEVRLDLPSHRDAVEVAERLEAEGLRPTRRWTFLLVGAPDREEAAALATRLRAEAPPGTKLAVQPGGEMLWEGWQRRPFAWLGDLIS
jgi:hypothetical protein